jgi:hypothetical protein
VKPQLKLGEEIYYLYKGRCCFYPLGRYEHLLVVSGSCVLEQLVTLCLVLWTVEDNVFYCLSSLSVIAGSGIS